ncbi:MAG: hypothetical protein A3E78_16945 [Alphaproteobacteria bacterium RIFCSPHIGHO2_12_FULL_63_12]|nr:MAG: hypothetical protein A3E78_16945 [Alphaproteobacteria bacterium RIFCSPHIGHO2_12_FULL_63_12]
MMETAKAPVMKARIAGLLYLLVIAGGLFAEAGVRQQLIVGGDPAATAQNILDNQSLFRVGFAVNLAYLLCNIPFAALFYAIFSPASRMIALMAALLVVATTAIEAVNLFHHVDALDLLVSANLSGFTPEQLQQMSYASLDAFGTGFAVSLVFFGVACILYGWLILQSGFTPRLIGLLMAIGGVCYLINSFAMFLAPDLASAMFPYILLPSLVGEASFALWLTIMGVDRKRWTNAAAAV